MKVQQAADYWKVIPFILLVLSIFTVMPAMADIIVYSHGFEADDGGYTHTGTLDQWEWGTPAFAAGPVSAHSGLRVWGTNLDGNVPYSSDSYLTSPGIAIPAVTSDQIIRVRFWAWIAVDEMLDRGEFQVSSDGISWETKSELFHVMQGDWSEYYFDITDYADGSIYLRYRLYADGGDEFDQSPYNMSGLYIDDVAIIISDKPALQTTLILEAYEDDYYLASCPWIYSWNGGEFEKDNDVYPTSRGPAKEVTDYYTLNTPVVSEDGHYIFKLQETDSESSYTDVVQLITVDHSTMVKISADDGGTIWTYGSPSAPASASTSAGNDAVAALSVEDERGLNVGNGDYVELDFNNLDITNGAILVLRVLGYQNDGPVGDPTYVTPAIAIQTQDSDEQWVTRHRFAPRMDWATSAYNLKDDFVINNKVRLYATSCHEGKYHIIDYVGMDTSYQAEVSVTTVPLASATHSVNGDVCAALQVSDNNYATMTSLESLELAFAVPAQSGEARDFVFVSEGYYVPIGTYFIYTWDGSQWAQRDGWSIEGGVDATRSFDLSMWLPDPSGEYKVRIWQDYWYENAGIDYVGMTQGLVTGTMISAFDLRKAIDVTALLISSDNTRDEWLYDDAGYPYSRSRNRWVEVKWTGLSINTPPTTNPVLIDNPLLATPTISWTYADVDGDSQVQFEVEVWTGTGGTGTNVWDPAIGTGDDSSIVYAGSPLVIGSTYYARVRAFDGTSWGGWSETSWTYELPPFTVEKDFRYTAVDFTPYNCGLDGICRTDDDYQEPADLGMTLPDTDGDGMYEVKYVVNKKGEVTSTNPGQLYAVITITGIGIDTVALDDAFGTQFDVNPGKLGGGVEVLKIGVDGLAEVLTDTPQVTFASVDNDAGEVILAIDLDTPLEIDEELMIYLKYQTALKFEMPDTTDFTNTADVTINEPTGITAVAVVEFV